jgi:phenylpropionate dioxygenase-like ring-hydroxylating dioxygenase large terminal subunit
MPMLPGAPWLLAHKSMLPVNQPKKISLFDRDYILWRDRLGKVNALSNVCPHMGAMLSEGWCEPRDDGSSAVVCPFHALEFDSEGCTVLPGSSKKTLPQFKPLDLMIEGDLIWTYGEYEAKIPIPKILSDIALSYKFIGYTADTSVETNLLTMPLNMHDYNHQNGTHRELFRITEVRFQQFIDNGHHSEAFFESPTASASLKEKLLNLGLFLLPDVIQAHLGNFFPSLVIFHGTSALGKIAQCHLFVPESETHTRTYILLYAQPKHSLFQIFEGQFLKFARVVVEQDASILQKLYADIPGKIKLNNEVGMDWVKRNFTSWPEIGEPNFTR